jgi:hypothetical protein
MKGIYFFVGLMFLGCVKQKEDMTQPNAQHSSVQQVSTCDSVNVGYRKDIVPILTKYCYSCHAGANPAVGNIDFSDYTQIALLTADSPYYVLNVISHNPRFRTMPPAPLEAPDNCDIAKVRKWTQMKAPNN